MSELKEKYGDKQTIEITDENYLEVMELIYNYPSEFIGKKISYEGFSPIGWFLLFYTTHHF